MRLDYILYLLGTLLLVVAVLPLVTAIEAIGPETRLLWIISAIVLGLLSIGLGYHQRPKTMAQACQLELPIEKPKQETQHIAKEVSEAKTAEIEKTQPQATISKASSAGIELTEIKGIGKTRAAQLKTIGISNAAELAKASPKEIAKSLKISLKITKKWVADANKQTK